MQSNTLTAHTVGVVEAAAFLGIGRNTAYRAVHRGVIPAVRIGRRFRIPIAALENMLANTSGGKEGK